MADDPDFVKFLRSMSEPEQELARRFPIGATVRAKPGVQLVTPAPGVDGRVEAYLLWDNASDWSVQVAAPLQRSITSPVTGVTIDAGEVLAGGCRPDQLELVAEGPVTRAEVAAILDG